VDTRQPHYISKWTGFSNDQANHRQTQASRWNLQVTYAPKVFDKILDRIANGESVRQICADDGFPSQETFYKWLRQDAEKAEKYARAKEHQADYYAEEIIEICDDASNDWMLREGKTALDAEHVSRSRLRVDTRKWLMGKLRPKKYGDKSEIDHTSSDGSMTPVQVIERVVVAPPPRGDT
jgi:hypothetical protein